MIETYVIKGDLESIKEELNRTFRINDEIVSQRTILTLATIHKKEEIVKYLLSIPDIDLYSQDRYQLTCLMYAVNASDIPMIDLIMKNGYDMKKHPQSSANPLLVSVRSNDIETVRCLLKYDNMDIYDSMNSTSPLHISSVYAHSPNAPVSKNTREIFKKIYQLLISYSRSIYLCRDRSRTFMSPIYEDIDIVVAL